MKLLLWTLKWPHTCEALLLLHVRVTVNSKGAAVLSEETQAAWNCWQVCCVTPAGRSATAGEGTPPPVRAVAVEAGTSEADVPGAAALGLVPLVWETLKVSGAFATPPAAAFVLAHVYKGVRGRPVDVCLVGSDRMHYRQQQEVAKRS